MLAKSCEQAHVFCFDHLEWATSVLEPRPVRHTQLE